MDYFLHRIKHESEISYPLLAKGILTYGWSIFSNPTVMNNIKTSPDVNKYLESLSPGNNSIYNLGIFLNEIKVDDIILVPTPGQFAFYKAKSCAKLINDIPDSVLNSLQKPPNFIPSKKGNLLVDKNNNPYDLGFYIEVEKITETVSRWEFANAQLTRYMKYQGSTLHIRREDIINIINSTIENIKNGITVNDEFKIRIIKCLTNAITECLHPDKMELLVKKYFNSIGGVTTRPNPTSDEGDCDVIAEFPLIKTVIFCQVKHHVGQTNAYSVDQIIAYNKNFKAREYVGYTRQLWVISTAFSFSDEAIQKAVDNNIQLISGNEFANMLIDAGILNLDI